MNVVLSDEPSEPFMFAWNDEIEIESIVRLPRFWFAFESVFTVELTATFELKYMWSMLGDDLESLTISSRWSSREICADNTTWIVKVQQR